MNSVKNNLEVFLLLGFLFISIFLFFVINHKYIHEKIKGWIIIISFLVLLFTSSITLYSVLTIFVLLAFFEFFRTLKRTKDFSSITKSIFGITFIFFLVGLISLIILNTKLFLYLFVVVSFSDIIAYFVGKHLSWKKGFTKLSPNKSLSGLIAQVLFIIICGMIYIYMVSTISFEAILVIISLAILSPIGDLTESYFKRKAEIKDMATYIPGHGGILDRIDSILLGGGIIGFLLLLNFY